MVVKQLGKEMLSPDLTKAQFDGPEAESDPPLSMTQKTSACPELDGPSAGTL